MFIGLLIGGLVMLLIGVPLIVLGAAGLGRERPGPRRDGQRCPSRALPAQPGQPYPAGPYPPGATPASRTVRPPPGAVAAYAAPPGTPYPVTPGATTAVRVPRPPPRLPRPEPVTVDVAREVVPGHPALHRPVFLWFAFGVVTIVAWFAILFTARYPRSLFNFNVGVIRWNWRVAFYAFSAIGTDVYPPFTLARTDYPADFDVDYPERLSRGLVLVKSWLLAIPHLLLIGLLTGTARTWEYRDGEWVQQGVGISLLGLLVLIAGVILLFTGQYRRGLFDLLLGLNRWIYRVIAYVALMRDEYPPFHLDMGPVDPGELPVPASPDPRSDRDLPVGACRHRPRGVPRTPPARTRRRAGPGPTPGRRTATGPRAAQS